MTTNLNLQLALNVVNRSRWTLTLTDVESRTFEPELSIIIFLQCDYPNCVHYWKLLLVIYYCFLSRHALGPIPSC